VPSFPLRQRPTYATSVLMKNGVVALFGAIEALASRGTAVIFISHRIHEVKSVADRISVLRDGHLMATRNANELSEHEVVDLIVGRELEARFPPKTDPARLGAVRLRVEGLRGDGFSDIALTAHAGEIVGLAGIEGQGQREVLRAIAGIRRSSGTVTIDNKPARLRNTTTARASGIVYLTHDRHREGLLPALDIRENAAAGALQRFAIGGFIRSARERSAVDAGFRGLHVKAASTDVLIDTLSGGNQQKVMFTRALLSEPRLLLADEPTQGVDVGARAELYGVLRNAADSGTCVLMLSADAEELAGICDRVVIFSRGHAVRELTGEEVTARRVVEVAMTATSGRESSAARPASTGHALRRLASSDLAPALGLVPLLIMVGLAGALASAFYLTTRNFSLTLPLAATLAFFAMGQQMVLLNGAIDLSIGPLAGLQVVLASFLLTPTSSGLGLVAGVVIIVGVGFAVGIVNWLLTVRLHINALIATLVTYSALQGVSLVLRPTPAGPISPRLTSMVRHHLSFVPTALVVALALAAGLEYSLYRTLWGVRLRASGSASPIARKVGVSVDRVALRAFVGASLLGTCGAFMLMAQSSTGNATIGNGYTLASIAAVVLGGASVYGGRGSFVGGLLGACMIIQINTVVQFLGWSREWQLYVLGGLTIVATAFYSRLRGVARV
jgi:ribose transport system ATP-binding protein